MGRKYHIKPTLIADEGLPLAMLAAVAHPEPALRRCVADRIETAIESRSPWYSKADVGEWLARHIGPLQPPFALGTEALQAAAWLIRLVFADATPANADHQVQIVISSLLGRSTGIIVGRQRGNLTCSFYDRNHPPEPTTFQLFADKVVPRLLGPKTVRLVKAVCQADEGFRVIVTGRFPWKRPTTLDNLAYRSSLNGRSLPSVGMKLLQFKRRLEICTNTPEAVILFAACLATAGGLVLRSDSQGQRERRILIGLRDFSGDSAEMPVVAGSQVRESWLIAPEVPSLELSGEERWAIIRWLYAPDFWIDESLAPHLPMPNASMGLSGTMMTG
jgi:hypothetical protein